MVHIPYRGTGPALNDLIGGQVDCFFTELATAYKLHTGGRARILAVATERRLDVLPDIPTVSEAGVPGFVSDTWNAISAPPRTPATIVSKLNRAVNAALDEPEIKARYQQQHLWPGGGSPADMAKLKKEETERWTKVIHDAGIEQQ
jgi:tripartite-type tricarboxylate transporter receptor subunit TctC